ALIFCFVLHQGKMNWSEAELKIGGAKSALAKYKTAGALEKTNVLSSENRSKIYFDYAESRKTTNVIEH
ncbi:MAG: hypothetical protein LBS20_20075, partial [Prevotella sp.]|nr:hypothetical protein [Prevotella sp.]